MNSSGCCSVSDSLSFQWHGMRLNQEERGKKFTEGLYKLHIVCLQEVGQKQISSQQTEILTMWHDWYPCNDKHPLLWIKTYNVIIALTPAAKTLPQLNHTFANQCGLDHSCPIHLISSAFTCCFSQMMAMFEEFKFCKPLELTSDCFSTWKTVHQTWKQALDCLWKKKKRNY